MSRYVDVDDVANAIYHHFPSARTMADARSVIEEAPTIDAVSVVHGEWIEQHENGHGFWVGICSQCGEENLVDNYCPNCGADMRGKDDE